MPIQADNQDDLHVADESLPTLPMLDGAGAKKRSKLPRSASESEPEIKKRIHYDQPQCGPSTASQKYQQLSILSMNLHCADPVDSSEANPAKLLPLSLQSLLQTNHNPRPFADYLNETPQYHSIQGQDNLKPPQEKGKLHSIINKILEENDALKKNLDYCQNVIKNYHGDSVKGHKQHPYETFC